MRDELLSSKGIAWSRLQRHRELIRERYPTIWGLKVIKNVSSQIKKRLYQGIKILDIGAFNRAREAKLRKEQPDIIYRSMDIDRGYHHDYYQLDEIQESFNLILLLEVIEHLCLQEGHQLLARASRLLEEGGFLYISTPNLYHPHRFWDLSHLTPYRYDDLGAMVLMSGLTIEGIYRVYNAPYLARLFRLYLANHIHRYLDLDFARSILIVGHKVKVDEGI